MIKKILIGFCVLNLLLFVNVEAYAQQVKDSALRIYSQELVSPLNFNVSTGDTLNLKIVNKSKAPAIFEIPQLSINELIDKNTEVIIPISFDRPASKNIWFVIKQDGSNNKTGSFIVSDYQLGTSGLGSTVNINTSYLKNIINYDDSYVYHKKPEPIYIDKSELEERNIIQVEEPTPKSNYVRGYW